MNPPTPTELADAFSKHLRETLTAEQLRKVVIRNRHETEPTVCHSHDFCDANESMLEAAWETGACKRGEFRADDSELADIMDLAWGHAKGNQFRPLEDSIEREPFDQLGSAIRGADWADGLEGRSSDFIAQAGEIYESLPPCYEHAEHLLDVIAQVLEIMEDPDSDDHFSANKIIVMLTEALLLCEPAE